MEYEQIVPVSKEEAEALLRTLEDEDLAKVLVAISNLDDVEYIESKYLLFINHPNDICSGAAILGLAHMARIHGLLNVQLVIGKLKELAKNRPSLQERVKETLSDISIFIG